MGSTVRALRPAEIGRRPLAPDPVADTAPLAAEQPLAGLARTIASRVPASTARAVVAPDVVAPTEIGAAVENVAPIRDAEQSAASLYNRASPVIPGTPALPTSVEPFAEPFAEAEPAPSGPPGLSGANTTTIGRTAAAVRPTVAALPTAAALAGATILPTAAGLPRSPLPALRSSIGRPRPPLGAPRPPMTPRAVPSLPPPVELVAPGADGFAGTTIGGGSSPARHVEAASDDEPPHRPDPVELDRLAGQLYGRIQNQLRSDLLIGRERAQLLTDLG